MVKREETIKFFAEQARNDFSKVEENAHKLILEIKSSQNKLMDKMC